MLTEVTHMGDARPHNLASIIMERHLSSGEGPDGSASARPPISRHNDQVQESEKLYCSLSEVVQIHEEKGSGSIVLDSQKNVVLVSPLAQQLMERCGLAVVDNQLVPGYHSQSREILQLIANGGSSPPSIVLRQPKDSGWTVMTASVAQVWNDGAATPEKHQILLLRAPSEVLGQKTECLASVFGLTRRESELACHLAVGTPIAQFAENQHVSINTAKSHLKQIFRKLGVHNQIELVACVLAVLL